MLIETYQYMLMSGINGLRNAEFDNAKHLTSFISALLVVSL